MPLSNPRNASDLPTTLKTLSLHPTPTPDSWEEEAQTPPSSPSTPRTTTAPENLDVASIPSAPPPTPISPTYRASASTIPSTATSTSAARKDIDRNVVWENPYGAPTSSTSAHGARPEKSTAVAGRMIAAGLGVRQPKKSEENRAYEKAVREKERKRREKEKVEERERVEEGERERRSVWEE